MDGLYLIAMIAERPVAIDSDQVDSVVDIGEIVPVPCAPPEVRGLAALRSRVVTVIDTVAALGLNPSGSAPGRAVITLVDGHYYAVLVDALDDVASFTCEPLDSGVPLEGGWSRVASAIVDRDGEAVLAIDLHRLIPTPLAVG
ncbi:MAG: chemotaxis protein CheW [Sphingomonas sp.]|uniref:chemotaxis protein CheW n=1 Tax=Sphingomonas sp. TaxID=28214 RepID=UPI000DB0B49E|nr:chemotaxis protein CheW [Zymomonas sp.]MBA4773605.1 chemotaxis protein CheW [Sphingomonas sp.]PZP13443.1 MAG: chemotaxis protein CheW [Sphingomonas hengshuiensis]